MDSVAEVVLAEVALVEVMAVVPVEAPLAVAALAEFIPLEVWEVVSVVVLGEVPLALYLLTTLL